MQLNFQQEEKQIVARSSSIPIGNAPTFIERWYFKILVLGARNATSYQTKLRMTLDAQIKSSSKPTGDDGFPPIYTQPATYWDVSSW